MVFPASLAHTRDVTTESTGDVYAVQIHNDIIVSSHEVGGIRLWSMADGTLIGEDDSLPLISRIVVDRSTSSSKPSETLGLGGRVLWD